MTAPTPLSPEEIEGLQKRLRERGEAWRAFAPDGPNGRDFLAAADAIADLRRQLAEAKAATENIWTDLCHSDDKRAEARAEVERLIDEALDVDRAHFLAELERVTRERDEAERKLFAANVTGPRGTLAAAIEALARLPVPTLPEETGDA